MSTTARMASGLIAAGVLLAGFATASAQTPLVNPTTVEFDPSPDHAALNAGGAPVVQRYELRLYRSGESLAAGRADLGKPAPEGDGKIRVNFSSLLAPWPPPDGAYEARVAAMGPSGEGESPTSNTFAFSTAPPTPPPPCSYALSPASAAVAAAGGSGTLTVTTASGCAWSVNGAPTWLALDATSGTGAATLRFTAAENQATSGRSASLGIAGQAFTVTQAAAACTYALSPATIAIGGGAASGSLSVTTLNGCGWSAASSAPWLTIGASSSGAGSGALAYAAAKNTTGAVRVATITAGGRASTITQGIAGSPSRPKKPKVTIAAAQ